MRRIANFIDAGHFTHTTARYGRMAADFRLLAERMAGECDLLRTYYWDCLPYLSADSDDQARSRFESARSFLCALSRLPRFVVREGQLERRGFEHDGTPIYGQKRVDVGLAVDLVVLATKHLITDAAILAGDSDFVPAIEAAKSEGVAVHLFHGPHAHRDLIRACDERTYVGQEFLSVVARKRTPRLQIKALATA